MKSRDYAIGNSIRACRLKAKIKQTQVINKLNISDTALISEYETGKRLPNLYRAMELADIYGVTLDELLGREVSKKDA